MPRTQKRKTFWLLCQNAGQNRPTYIQINANKNVDDLLKAFAKETKDKFGIAAIIAPDGNELRADTKVRELEENDILHPYIIKVSKIIEDVKYYPDVTEININQKFPQELVEAYTKKREESDFASLHASTIFITSRNNPDLTIREFFNRHIVPTEEWNLAYSAESRDCRDKVISDYQHEFEEDGLRFWDIQNRSQSTLRLDLIDTSGVRITFAGRANYLLSEAPSPTGIWQKAQCIIEVQSNDDEEACELQLLVYLLIAMNRGGNQHLLGLLVFKDKRCRLYKAQRDIGMGNSLFYSNGMFEIWQAPNIIKQNL